MKLSTLKRINPIMMRDVGRNRRHEFSKVILTNESITFLSPDVVVTIMHGILFAEKIPALYVKAEHLFPLLSIGEILRVEINPEDEYARFSIPNKSTLAIVDATDMENSLDDRAKLFHQSYDRYGIFNAKDIENICDAAKYVADDQIREQMSYVVCDNEYIVGSDAHCLLYLKKSKETGLIDSLNIPPIIQRLLSLFKDQSFDFLKSKGVVATRFMRLANETVSISWDASISEKAYPNWRSVVPEFKIKSPKDITADNVIDRRSVYVSQKEIETILQFMEAQYNTVEKLELEISRTIVTIRKEGESAQASSILSVYHPEGTFEKKTTIGIMQHYLAEAIRRNKGNNAFKIDFGDPTQAFVFNDNFLVMPCML